LNIWETISAVSLTIDVQFSIFEILRSPVLHGISSAMTLLEVSRATVYRMVEGELELLQLGARSGRIVSEGVAKAVAEREKSTDLK
jgi:hypothetical protein